MLSIEEAFAELEESCGRRMKLHKPAARALAESVLEEAKHWQFRFGGLNAEKKLRAQIKALGK